MTITRLPPEHAHCLVALNLQVQAVHSAEEPDRYVTDPDPEAVAAFLTDWLAEPHVTALISGPQDAPTGYLIYEILKRPKTALRQAECRAMLHHICVDEAHRRMGIGRELISAFKDQDDVRAADSLRTSYAAFNTASAELMRAMGFVPSVIFAGAPAVSQAER